MEYSEFEKLNPEQQAKIRQIIADLEELFASGEAAQKRMEAFSKEMLAAVKTAVNCHFPDVMRLEAEGYRKLNEVIYRSVDKLAGAIDEIMHNYRIR